MARTSKTLTPAAQAGFLAALARGALVVAAAREAGVAVSTLYCRRARDPGFAEAWEDSVAASVRAARPPKRRTRFDAGRRGRYLAALARSCDTTAAAAAAGVHRSAVYRRMARDPGFAGDCADALARGYMGLEGELAEERAAAARWREIVPDGAPTRDFDEAMRLMARWERPDGSIEPRFVRHGRQQRWTFEKAIALLAKRLRGLGVLGAGA